MYRYEGPPNGKKRTQRLLRLARRRRHKMRGKNFRCMDNKIAYGILLEIFGEANVKVTVEDGWGPRW